MEIIAYAAISLDGYVASHDGKEDFFSDEMRPIFLEYATKYNNLLLGKPTFDTIKTWEEEWETLQGKNIYILTTDKSFQELPYTKQVIHDIDSVVALEEQSILITGPTVINNFLERKIVNKLVISIEPIFLGAGIPLGKKLVSIPLTTNNCIVHESGIVTIEYTLLS